MKKEKLMSKHISHPLEALEEASKGPNITNLIYASDTRMNLAWSARLIGRPADSKTVAVEVKNEEPRSGA